MENEHWKQIIAWPRYEASTHGRIRQVDGDVCIPRIDAGGYPRVYVIQPALAHLPFGQRAGQRRTAQVHVLVLLAFQGLPPVPGLQGCHNDGNKLNSRPDNLRWDTAKANFADRRTHSTFNPNWTAGMSHNVGEAHGRAKFTDELVREIRASTEPGVTWANRLGVSKAAISTIRSGKRWAHVK
jgi:hypothetical protein